MDGGGGAATRLWVRAWDRRARYAVVTGRFPVSRAICCRFRRRQRLSRSGDGPPRASSRRTHPTCSGAAGRATEARGAWRDSGRSLPRSHVRRIVCAAARSESRAFRGGNPTPWATRPPSPRPPRRAIPRRFSGASEEIRAPSGPPLFGLIRSTATVGAPAWVGAVCSLAAKNQDELLLLEEMRDYLKRRSDIESAYQDQLSKLATSVLANRKRVVKPGPDGKDKDDRKYGGGPEAGPRWVDRLLTPRRAPPLAVRAVHSTYRPTQEHAQSVDLAAGRDPEPGQDPRHVR